MPESHIERETNLSFGSAAVLPDGGRGRASCGAGGARVWSFMHVPAFCFIFHNFAKSKACAAAAVMHMQLPS